MVLKMKKENDIKYVKKYVFGFPTEYLKNVTMIFLMSYFILKSILYIKSERNIRIARFVFVT